MCATITAITKEHRFLWKEARVRYESIVKIKDNNDDEKQRRKEGARQELKNDHLDRMREKTLVV